MRAFIAVELPEALKREVAAVQGRLKDAGVDASWPRPEGLHLTLKFLGEIDEARVPAIMQALATALAGMERFPLGIEGVGTFPKPSSARVVWMGVAVGAGRIAALQGVVERAAVDAGLAPEDRPFTPHLTLGRIRGIRDRKQWLSGLAGVAAVRLPEFDASSVKLISSELKPSGAVYRELGAVALK